MKVTYLAAACAALCSASAFAATLDPVTTTPDVKFYIAGASAQRNALLTSIPSTLFDTTTTGVLHITGPNGSEGWLGMSKAAMTTTSKKLLVIYQSKNGSAAGLNQVISAGSPEAEAVVLSLPATAGCTPGATPTAPDLADAAATCSGNSAVLEADMGLSDVYSGEFAAGVLTSGSTLKKAGSSSTTGLEGFGVIVNAALYNALIQQNIHDGLLPASCGSATAATASTASGACQPSVRAADYASLVTQLGRYNNWKGLVPNQAAANITVCRRDDLSGTQAASNIYFLNNVCGSKGYLGALVPATDGLGGVFATGNDSVADTGDGTSYTVADFASGGNAESCVSGASGYAAGVVSLGEKDALDGSTHGAYYFVKLDGVSPNFKLDGTYDAKHRVNFLNGDYTFATEMAAVVKSTTSATSVAGKMAKAVADEISKAANSDLTGIGYIDSTISWPTSAQAAKYVRGGNNCANLH